MKCAIVKIPACSIFIFNFIMSLSPPELLEESIVAVFKFRAFTIGKEEEDHCEEGTVVARDQADAREKLRRERFTNIKLKQLKGVSALISQFTADIR